MATNLHLIREINPQTCSWTVKVQVVEKTDPHTSATSRKFQRFILQDGECTRVQATIFGSDIELYKNTLTVRKKYHISNASVRPIPSIHRIVPNDYQWTINGATLVEEITNDVDIESSQQIDYKFTPFSELSLHTGQNSTVDIIAIALKIDPEREINAKNGDSMIRELLLITQEMKPITLTMWDQFVPNEASTISNIIQTWPILLATRLKVGTYNGLSLSTKSTSFLMVNPDIIEASTLRSWSANHKEEINGLILGMQPTQAKITSTTQDIIDISTATKMQSMDPFWIKASASITDLKQKFWYIGCSNCFKTIHVDSGRTYNCRHCHQRDVTAKPRCRFDVDLHDSSGNLNANCFGDNAEKLFHITAAQLKDKTNKDGVTNEEFIKAIPSSIVQPIRLKPYKHAETNQRKLTITLVDNELLETSEVIGTSTESSSNTKQPTDNPKIKSP